MAEKKRQGAVSAAAPPMKKSKKSTVSEPAVATLSDPGQNSGSNNGTLAASKRPSRKRAADFLDDTDTQSAPATSSLVTEAPKPNKKSKKSVTAQPAPPIAEQPQDGNPATAEDENEGSVPSDDEDQGAALLAGFDSDNDDLAEDQGDMSKTQPIPQFKKTSKKLKQAKEKGSDAPGAVYVGRIPHGFYEHQMRDYFTQFGTITRLRLSRNKKTGASKHFAFIEFESDEVAKIVAETMDNYLMFGHILKCKYAPSEQLHPDVWKGANKKFRRIPHDKLQRQQLEAPKTQEQWERKNEREQKRRQLKAEKLKAIGYEYVAPKLANPADVIEQKKADQQKDTEEAHGIPQMQDSAVPDMIEAPSSVPADEVALKKEKKFKKAKSSGTRELLTEGNLDAKNAGSVAESDKVAEDEADKASHIATKDNDREVNAIENAKQRRRKKKDIATDSIDAGASVISGSSHNQYDKLSSIPIGIEAASAHATDAVADLELVQEPDGLESIATEAGVADAVLKGRKADRKKIRNAGKSVRSQVEDEVSALVPKASQREKKGRGQKAEKAEKQVKGILKREKRA